MPDSPLKILIVEDADMLPDLMQKVIDPLLKRFPNSTVITTGSLKQALTYIAEFPPPDVVTLDLTLDDSSLENTMAHIESIESRSPVLVVTGGNVEPWGEMLKSLQIEVIDKGSDWLRDNVLVQAIVRAYMRGANRRAEQQRERLKIMRNISEALTANAAA